MTKEVEAFLHILFLLHLGIEVSKLLFIYLFILLPDI